MRTRSMVASGGGLALVLAALVGVGPAHADAATCHGVRATIVGTDRSEVITGSARRDVIAARGGNDTVDGRGGNDLICGGRGMDRLTGGRGDDTLFGGPDWLHRTDEGTTERDGDTLRGGPGSDHLYPGHDTRVADDVNLDALTWDDSTGRVSIDVAARTARGEGHDVFAGRGFWVVGSSYGDLIDGSDRGNHINGGPGSDVIRGRGGNDRIIADNGNGTHGYADVVYGGRGEDQISADRGQDRLYGGPGADIIDDVGKSGDVLAGGDGDDLIIGQLYATDRPQSFAGGPGRDRLSILTTYVNPTASAGTGHWNMATGTMTFTVDTTISLAATGFEHGDLAAYGTTWTVDGTSGPDGLVAAGTAGTVFNGLAGEDEFMGSASDDRFIGGPGYDRSLGMGVGDDTCVGVEVVDADCEHVS